MKKTRDTIAAVDADLPRPQVHAGSRDWQQSALNS